MTIMRVVEVDARKHTGTALIAADDSVWVAVSPPWFDLSTWFWWWLTPADKKAWVLINGTNGKTVRSRAIRVARKHVRIRGVVK